MRNLSLKVIFKYQISLWVIRRGGMKLSKKFSGNSLKLYLSDRTSLLVNDCILYVCTRL